MDNIAGPPVEGRNFYGREAELSRLQETLQQHDVLLLGPRRIGKTSFARAMQKQVQADGWHTLEINVASCPDEKAWVQKLAAAVDEHMRSAAGRVLAAAAGGVGDLLGRIEKVQLPLPGTGGVGINLRPGAGEDWSVVANDTLRLMSRAKHRWLIYVDELPIFLHTLIRNDKVAGVQRVRRFLDWFRKNVRALPDCQQMRWLITGSVGLDTLVQRHQMADTINSLKHEGLAPFTQAQAVAMVLQLSKRYALKLSEDDALALVTAVHWPQPYYLQLVFHHLRQLAHQNPAQALAKSLGAAMDAAVQPGADNDFHHWEQRLFLQLGDEDAGHALALLTLAAQTPVGHSPEGLLVALQARMPDDTDDAQRRKFIELRDILLRDAYWAVDQNTGVRRYAFCLEPLRRWWQRRQAL